MPPVKKATAKAPVKKAASTAGKTSPAKKAAPKASSAKTTTAKTTAKKTTATKAATPKKTTSSAAKTTKSTKATSTKSATINTWDAKSLCAVTHLIIKIIASDGNVSDREVVFLNKLLGLFGVKGTDLLLAIQGAKAFPTASAIKQVSAFGPNLKKMTADMLKTAVKSDGKVTDQEMKVLADIVKKCNLDI